MGHEGFNLLQGHTFPDRPFHPYQANAVLVFNQFTDGPDPPVTEMVNVINLTLLIFQADQVTNGFNNVFLGQGLD